MKAALDKLADPFFEFLKTKNALERVVESAFNQFDEKLEFLVHTSIRRVFLANTTVETLWSAPVLASRQLYPITTQIVGLGIAGSMLHKQTLPAKERTISIKAAHALATAFFMNTLIGLCQSQNEIEDNIPLTGKLVDGALAATFFLLSMQKEAICVQKEKNSKNKL